MFPAGDGPDSDPYSRRAEAHRRAAISLVVGQTKYRLKMILTSNARLKGLYVSVDTEFLLFERDVCFFHADGIGLLSSSLAESFGFCRRGIATTMNFRGGLSVSVLVSDGSGGTLVPVSFGSA